MTAVSSTDESAISSEDDGVLTEAAAAGCPHALTALEAPFQPPVGEEPMTTEGLPHPPRRLPFIGDMWGGSFARPTQDTVRMAKRHNLGPIFSRKIFGNEFVFVASPHLMADVCDESRFAKFLFPGLRYMRPLAGDALFTAYHGEPSWQQAHNILMPAFTQNSMHRYHDTMWNVASQMTRRWSSRARAGLSIDVVDDVTRLTLETIAQTGFGYTFHSFDSDEPHPFPAALARSLRFAQMQGYEVPGAKSRLNRRAIRRNAADIAYMHGEVDRVVQARIAELEGGGTDEAPNDLLSLMLEEADPATGQRLTAEQIRYQIVTFLGAGYETTSSSLGFALYFLLNNPDVFAKARAEVDAVWGTDPDVQPTFEQITKLRYVRRVFEESLRLWPTAPGFTRKALHDQTLGGYPIKKDQWIVVVLGLVHRDPVFGEDTDTFDPDRFLPVNVRARPAQAYKPFGTGERACIGRQFAVHEAVMALGRVVANFDLHDTYGYELKVKELLTQKPEGFRMTITERQR